MQEVDETIEFLEKKLQELRKFKHKTEEEIAKEDMIEERLEKIEKTIVTIKKAIVN